MLYPFLIMEGVFLWMKNCEVLYLNYRVVLVQQAKAIIYLDLQQSGVLMEEGLLK